MAVLSNLVNRMGFTDQLAKLYTCGWQFFPGKRGGREGEEERRSERVGRGERERERERERDRKERERERERERENIGEVLCVSSLYMDTNSALNNASYLLLASFVSRTTNFQVVYNIIMILVLEFNSICQCILTLNICNESVIEIVCVVNIITTA